MSSRIGKVNFPPIQNGIDYLTSAVSLLQGLEDSEDEQRDLKYVVLHLQAATEVLLKLRVIQEHWSLVFRDPGKATQEAYKSGEFTSIGLEEILGRLKGILGINLSPAAQESIRRLARIRNKLQHFGLVEQAVSIEILAGEVLDSLLVFIASELQPGAATKDQEALAEIQETIREEVNRVGALLQAREKRVKPKLDEQADHVVLCPGCSKVSLIIDGGAQCLICEQVWSGEEAAGEYAGTILGRSWHDVVEGGSEPVEMCPDCGSTAFVSDVTVRAEPRNPMWACFNCGITARPSSVDNCYKCGAVMFMNEETGTVCSDCWRAI